MGHPPFDADQPAELPGTRSAIIARLIAQKHRLEEQLRETVAALEATRGMVVLYRARNAALASQVNELRARLHCYETRPAKPKG